MPKAGRPAPPEFDVVVVPDFSGPVARRFEIMTLLFLASWMEFGGRSRNLPLHLACIGDVPESVRILAERCGAEITTHTPVLFGAFANKLRGFEVNRKTDHILLLDSDMLVLSEIHELPGALGDNCISAAASNGPCRLGANQWRLIHEALDVPYPKYQVTPLNRDLDTFQCAPYRDWTEFPPYYNGGIVFAPWASHMGDVWRDHLVRIFEIDPNIRGPKNEVSNQPSLATAIHELHHRGFEFRLLPDEYHVRWQHIATGTVPSKQTKLLHTIGFGRWSSDTNDNSAERDIDIYLLNTLKLTRDLRSHRGRLVRSVHYLTRRSRIQDCYRVHALMKSLYETHVRELKR
jgi:hypothetical protein